MKGRVALSVTLACAFALIDGAAAGALAAAFSDDAKLPRFVSLKESEVNMREGPSVKNKVRWVFHRKGLPVEILEQYDVWRRVRDSDGDIGWINANMLSREREGLVTGTGQASLRDKEDTASGVVAQVEPGAVGVLKRCSAKACEMEFGKVEGWMDRSRIWGVYPNETF
jgi:SH3-like domain-containing protein